MSDYGIFLKRFRGYFFEKVWGGCKPDSVRGVKPLLVIPLGLLSPINSSELAKGRSTKTVESLLSCFWWGLPHTPITWWGVIPKITVSSCRRFITKSTRFAFCCTFRSLAAPSVSLVSFSYEVQTFLSLKVIQAAIACFPNKDVKL